MPLPRRQKFRFEAKLTTNQFMQWEEGECRQIKFGRITKKRKRAGHSTQYTTYRIPAPYHRIVSQLISEDAHAVHHNSHESYRRQLYALRVLDTFASELQALKTAPTAAFRSKVLTPILQRQLMGVHNAYTPSVRRAIADGDGGPTIDDATYCYLSLDPVSLEHIPQYRHHLLYIPEAHWHLGVVMDPSRCGNAAFYNRIRVNHDSIMGSSSDDGETAPDEIPLLTREEVRAIFDEDLTTFFEPELALVVSPMFLLPASHTRSDSHSTAHHCK